MQGRHSNCITLYTRVVVGPGDEALRSAALAILITACIVVTAAEKETAAAQETVVVTATRVPSLIGDEPIRIESFYQVTSARMEPVGLAYLWPVTG